MRDPSVPLTMSMSATRAGVMLGTAAYMSPEQVRGRPAGRRADIWAFGVVLYEMLTGKCPFLRETISDTMAAVLTKEPELGALPAHVAYVVQRCLSKDLRKRWQAIGDVRMALEEGWVVAPPSAGRTPVPWLVTSAILAVALIAALVGLWHARGPVQRPLVRLRVDLGSDAASGKYPTAVLSPDASRLVYIAARPDNRPRLMTRLLDQPQATILSGTDGADWPFFSPDGQWIGFFAEGKLKNCLFRAVHPSSFAKRLAPLARVGVKTTTSS